VVVVDSMDEPAALIAATRNVYVVPFVRPVIRALVAADPVSAIPIVHGAVPVDE
jgi:hypothetical protein